MLIKVHELNERYHDTKQKMAWLDTSLYATFSLAIFRILFFDETQKFIVNHAINNIPNIIPILVLLAVVCFCVYLFAIFQYQKKKISVEISGKFMEILSDKTLPYEKKLNEMFDVTKEINCYWKEYKKE